MVQLVFGKTKNPKMFTVQGENPSVIHLLQGRTVIGQTKGEKTVKEMYIKQQVDKNPPPTDDEPTLA